MTQVFMAAPTWRVRLWGYTAALALIVMENTVVALWYQALFRPPILWASCFFILLAIFGLTYLLASALSALKWPLLARQALLLLWIVICIFASLKWIIYPRAPIALIELIQMPLRYIFRSDIPGTNFYHLIFVLLLAWRGAALARSPVTLGGAQFSFQVNLVALLLYGMMLAPLNPGPATFGLYLFLFCGLVAMSAARIANLSELRGGRIPRFGSGWTLSILLASGAVVGLAMLLGWLTSGQITRILATLLVVFFSLLAALVLFLFSPVLVFLANLMPYLAEILQQLLERLRNIANNEQVQKLVAQLSEGLVKVIPYVMAGRALFLLALLAGLILAVLLVLRLRALRQRLVEEEESASASLGETGGLLQRLLRMLQDARGLKLRSPAQLLAAARIRQIYRQLMQLCGKLGQPRPASLTPLEFLPRMAALFPEENAPLEEITGAYLKVRYGEYPESRAEVEAVERAWEQVRRQGRKVISNKGARKVL